VGLLLLNLWLFLLVFCRKFICFFVLLILAIVLSGLRFTAFGFFFGSLPILFLYLNTVIVTVGTVMKAGGLAL
jgi:hypothetical protein